MKGGNVAIGVLNRFLRRVASLAGLFKMSTATPPANSCAGRTLVHTGACSNEYKMCCLGLVVEEEIAL